MNFNPNCGCCPQAMPTYSCCNNVVNKCFVQEVPHYTNFHTHVVNNCVRKHVNIPTFSTDEETVVIDEYAQAQPMYMNQPMMNPYQQQPMYFNEQQNINFYQQPAASQGFEMPQNTMNVSEGQQPYFNPNFNPYSF